MRRNNEEKSTQSGSKRETKSGNKMDNNMITNKSGKSSKLKEKVFIERKSLILEMFEEKHIKNIHYVLMMVFLSLLINAIFDGIIHEGKWSLNINIIINNFSDGHVGIIGWLILFTSTLLVYPVLQLWIVTHLQLQKLDNKILRRSWDILWMGIVLGYYYKIMAWTGSFVSDYNLSFTTSFTLLVETCRFLMKSHAFIRGNIEKVLQERDKYTKPSKIHFLEFLFMPTLVYKDSYPRTKSVNWVNVLVHITELGTSFLFICYLYNLYYKEDCNYFATTANFHIKEYIWLIFRNTLPCLIMMFIMFYIVLHLFQNLFGELTRFADRQFYQDWWNSISYDEYFRKWNIVVHDWLYNYIYKDVFQLLTPQSTLIPKLFVFTISSIVHEYILYYTMRMFYPVLGTIFLLFAMILTSFRSPKIWFFNVLFLYGLAFGFSITVTSYIVEYCLRRNPCAINSPNYPYDWIYSKTFVNDCHA